MWWFISRSPVTKFSRVTSPPSSDDNVRCILFMVIAMAGFAIEDAVIKQLSATMPISQVLMLIGAGGLMVFGTVSCFTRVSLVTAQVRKPWFIIRTLAELASAIFFVIAIVYASLSASSAILQATPLATFFRSHHLPSLRICLRFFSKR